MPPAQAISENFSKLKAKLRELFQLDRGDLDFGLYRIMAHKSAEVGAFLENDLLPQITEALGDIAQSDTTLFEDALEKAAESAWKLGFDPEQSPKIKELHAQIKAAKTDQQTEADTYNHLCNFFSRYYDEGDFMSLRRYKGASKDAYSIPYNGEEVKLHWANADQYYIKTTENYASYIFTVGGGKRRVRFEIAAADNEKDTIKEANGKQRHFVLSNNFIAEDRGELVVRFEHRPLTEGEKKKHPQNGVKRQASINAETEQRIRAKLQGDWPNLLLTACPTEADPQRTLLGKHITVYTAKNSFDYFIHKDLGGFLRRELDAFLKSDVLSIDNLTLADNPMVFIRSLAQLKAIKLVGDKIIDFLAQLENFQKQLWLKKKFVLETQYCATLDKVPESLYPAIAKNKRQHAEWKALYSPPAAAGKPFTTEFLKQNPHLVLDTKHFDDAFKDRLLAALSEAGPMEESLNGLLVHGENFQGLNLLQERYKGQVRSIYIDPPYNTPSSEIMYKNDYKHSSWITLLTNRMELSKALLSDDGISMTTIDYEEFLNLGYIADQIFDRKNQLGIITIYINPKGRQHEKFFSSSTEYMFVYANDIQKTSFASVVIDSDKLEEFCFEDGNGKYRLDPFARIRSSTKRELKPDFWYPIYVSPDLAEISSAPKPGYHAVYPTQNGVEYSWKVIQKSFEENLAKSLYVAKQVDGEIVVCNKFYEGQVLKNIWTDKKYFPEFHGTNLIKNLFGDSVFSYPKSINAVSDSLKIASANGDVILDYFAGSGTTGHAVINLNREDGGNRKYILVEIGKHFDEVLLPRMKKAVYAADWKDGKPDGGGGVSQLFKYIRLESYEDALDSLAVNSREALLEKENKTMAEDYHLRYALGEETADNASLVGQDFIDPFNYTLSVVRDGTRGDVAVDVAETFNFLLGLRLAGRRRLDGVLAITGRTRQGENCLILWRDMNKMNAAKLDQWFTKHRQAFGDDLHRIYVNGDHTLNALQTPADKWEAVTTEPVFRRLMFNGAE
ncbi:MAG: site-specific DNA-methyltransferase [Gammaproteobacteria bacterium]|nr:site-specific DNA-methyltransferase [Gammaproteobacteria bacterium]